MNNEFDIFISKTNDLLELLVFFSNGVKAPKELENSYSDFYLKHMISNNYTNFENYIRNCLSIISNKLSECKMLEKDMISEELRHDIIERCLSRFPTTIKDSRIYNNDKKQAALYLNNMLNNELYIFKLEEHSFVQLPHSVAELEKILCKYFNKQKVLHDIDLTVYEYSMTELELISKETAFVFLNRYVEKLRHPIIHQGINLYMNENIKIEVNVEYVIIALNNFCFIASALNEIFSNYYQKLTDYQITLERMNSNNEDNLINEEMVA